MTAEVKALIERFDHLRNSGVCSPTTRGLLDDAEALLAALSIPPADDVREALESTIQDAWTVEADGDLRSDVEIARLILSRFVVRPRGTVTEAEVRDVPGFEGTWDSLDGISIRGGEPS